MAKIILSYRRSDSRAMAGRIRDKLAERYGDRTVYMDVDDIPFGTDFRRHINAALNEGDVLVAIIGQKWTGAGRGRKARLLDESDPVRVEIETALQRGVAIIPILVDGVKMPKPADLSETLRNLAFNNAAEVDDGRGFHLHMDRVIRSLDPHLKSRQRWVGIIAGRAGWAAAALIMVTGLIATWFYNPLLVHEIAKLANGNSQKETIAANGGRFDSSSNPASPQRINPATATPSPAAVRQGAPSIGWRVALVVGNAVRF